jgi:hypothetical protein
MIDHERYRLLAAAEIDGLLSPDEARELHHHLAGCSSCAAESDALRRDSQLLASLPPQPVAPRVRRAVVAAIAGRTPRRSWTLLAAAALLPLALAGGALLAGSLPSRTPQGAIRFAEPETIALGGTLRSVASADLDGDGDLDLAVADTDEEGPVHVLLGDGRGRFGGQARYYAEHPFNLEIADLDLDGVPDLASGNPGCTCVGVLYGDGLGGFGEPQLLTAGLQPRTVLVLDVNGDDRPDLLVPNASSDQLSILLGRGGREFGTATNLDGGLGPWAIAAGDFNADGSKDLAVAAVNSGTVGIMWADGAGGFARPRPITDFGAPANLEAGDLDRDGDADLVVRSVDRPLVTVGYTDPAGPLFETLELDSPRVGDERMGAVAVADLDGDDWLDLVVGGGQSSELFVYVGDGQGGFDAALRLNVGAAPVDVAVGDFDRDGRADVATVNYLDGTLSILLQR